MPLATFTKLRHAARERAVELTPGKTVIETVARLQVALNER